MPVNPVKRAKTVVADIRGATSNALVAALGALFVAVVALIVALRK